MSFRGAGCRGRNGKGSGGCTRHEGEMGWSCMEVAVTAVLVLVVMAAVGSEFHVLCV